MTKFKRFNIDLQLTVEAESADDATDLAMQVLSMATSAWVGSGVGIRACAVEARLAHVVEQAADTPRDDTDTQWNR